MFLKRIAIFFTPRPTSENECLKSKEGNPFTFGSPSNVYLDHRGLFFLKETEIHTAICYMTEEAWMLAEIVVLTMLENKHATRL